MLRRGWNYPTQDRDQLLAVLNTERNRRGCTKCKQPSEPQDRASSSYCRHRRRNVNMFMVHTVLIINFDMLKKEDRSSAESSCVYRTGRYIVIAFLSTRCYTRCFRVQPLRRSRHYWQHTCPTSENFIKCGGPMVTGWTSTIDPRGPESSRPSFESYALSIQLLYCCC
jgi:hypothetical protein